MLQEFICSPEDVLGLETGAHIGPLTATVAALSHAMPPRSRNDIRSDPEQDPNDPNESPAEVNHYKNQLRRYSEERFVSNFNFVDQNYTIDEAEEYQLNYENNNEQNYSPVYNEGLRNRGPYYQTNRVQFVTPFYKGNVLKSENFEIYDTDEVDFPMELRQEDVQRYDREKMNLDIPNNHNRDLNIETEAAKDDNRVFYTCLCVGTFFVSTILLILYPL